MDDKKELPKRKATRLKDFDYCSHGTYFITICTEKRQRILSRIFVDGGSWSDVSDIPIGNLLDIPMCVELLPCGRIADKYINKLNTFYDNITVKQYVIMPDHIHIMLSVRDAEALDTLRHVKQHSTVSHFVSTFKRFCNKEYGGNIWQRHFNDHIIRNQQDYEEHVKYICENPSRWYFKELYADK